MNLVLFLAHRNAQKLLWTLLGLQEGFLNEVDGVDGVANGLAQMRDSPGAADEDEEIPSEEEEDIPNEEGEEDKEEGMAEKRSVTSLSMKSRKRKHSSLSEGQRDCEAEVELLHSRLRPYRNTIIAKWNEKTRLATGKITSKVSVDSTNCIPVNYLCFCLFVCFFPSVVGIHRSRSFCSLSN